MSSSIKPIAEGVPKALMQALEISLKDTQVVELNTDAWSLGVLKEVKISDRLRVDVVLPTFGLASEKKIAFAVKKALVDHVADPDKIDLYVYSDVKPAAVQSINTQDIADVRNVILVSSGKGGVGKSTVSSNLAVAMASLGCRVGLLDADVYGPSIPIMFGLQNNDGEVKGFVHNDSNTTYMIPPVKYDVSLMSLGFLVDTKAPMIWRGPMIASACMQMFHNVYWGQIDYLIVDLPPGTGDIQLTIAQKINVAGAIIVSTPQDVALQDVIRAKKMFDKVNIPTLGLIENMSYFLCDGCDKRHEIFASGGAKLAADELNMDVLGDIPLITGIRSSCDKGLPAINDEKNGLIKESFIDIANKVCAKITRRSMSDVPSENTKKNNPHGFSGDNVEKKRRLPVL